METRGVKWERLTLVRSPFLLLLGLAALCVGAFMVAVAAGWAAVGVALIVMAYLTDSAPSEGAQR
jgi:hypothetical protein